MSETETVQQTARRLADQECASLHINPRSFQGCVIHQRRLRSLLTAQKDVISREAAREAFIRSDREGRHLSISVYFREEVYGEEAEEDTPGDTR